MTETEQQAVAESARRMREWHAENRILGANGKPRYQTGGRGRRGGHHHPGADTPDYPLVQLRKEGAIDVAREAHLTALAYRMSREEAQP